ncbi:MAG TPA: hypothetical protein VJQ59_06815 [Candidatus Sulfotelmatobacter sp.]|nr:hypothetical protein [Candidatus Sulfotelmatobacter sp.]
MFSNRHFFDGTRYTDCFLICHPFDRSLDLYSSYALVLRSKGSAVGFIEG